MQILKGQTNFNKIIFMKDEEQKLGGGLKFKINILLYGGNS
jgi:hypothetical protein